MKNLLHFTWMLLLALCMFGAANASADNVEKGGPLRTGRGNLVFFNIEGGDQTCQMEAYFVKVGDKGRLTADRTRPFASGSVWSGDEPLVVEATYGANIFNFAGWTVNGHTYELNQPYVTTETFMLGNTSSEGKEFHITLHLTKSGGKPTQNGAVVTFSIQGGDENCYLQGYVGHRDNDKIVADKAKPFNSGDALAVGDWLVLEGSHGDNLACKQWLVNGVPVKFDGSWTTENSYALNGIDNEPVEIKWVLTEATPSEDHTFTFGIKGQNATDANATLTVVKQIKNEKGKWVDDGEVTSGSKVAAGQHLSIKATYNDEAYIIKNWLHNGKVVMHTPKTGEPFVSTFRTLYWDMTAEDTNIELELDKPNMTWSMELPKEVTGKDDKKAFSLTLFNADKKIFGQKMKGFVYGYYQDALKDTEITMTATVLDGYRPVWIVNGNLSNGHELTQKVTAGESLDIKLSFEKSNATQDIVTTASVYAQNGAIVIAANSGDRYSVYALDGRLLETSVMSGSVQNVKVLPGAYIVVLNGKSYKVIVR